MHDYTELARTILANLPGCETVDCSCCGEQKATHLAAALRAAAEQVRREERERIATWVGEHYDDYIGDYLLSAAEQMAQAIRARS